MNRKSFFPGKPAWTLGLIILGWVVCGYLAYRSSQLKGDPGSIPDICLAIFGSSCDKALQSILAWRLGYHLTGWGLAYFGLLGLLFSFRTRATGWIVLFLSAFGTGVSLLQTIIIIRSGISCPLCLAIHGINVAVLISLVPGIWSATFSGSEPNGRRNKALIRWMAPVILLLAAGGVSEYGILKRSYGQTPSVSLDELAKNFRAEPVFDIPVFDESPRMGSPEAPVQIVVFSSFQCPACKGFGPSAAHLFKQFGDKVSIRFKNFPLSTQCNPMLVEDMQPLSCQAAFAALAAYRQNHFWEYHDQVFQSSPELDSAALSSIARKTGLNIEQWEKDRQSDDTKALLAKDLVLAHAIGINATPTVLINGRRVASFQESALVFLIQNELDALSK